nr:lectin like domain-containing protein [Eubacterium sp. 1001713B170207_170306_E7]
MPEKLDLREADLDGDGVVEPSYVTTTKQQSPWGTCWAFGALSAIESNYIKATGSTAEDVDFSERYHAWFGYTLDHGEGIEPVKNAGKRLDFGGNRNISSTVLSSWSGPAKESAAPYQANDGDTESKDTDWTLPDNLIRDPQVMSDARVQNIDFLPSTAIFTDQESHQGYVYSQAATEAIKQAIVNNGVVELSYCAAVAIPGEAPDYRYLNMETKAHYTYEYVVANHAVSIVGWDDNYSVRHFNEGHQPVADGAWIVKNSWGSYEDKSDEGWEANKDKIPVDRQGYFYLSYYDQSVCDFTSYQVDTDTDGLFAYDNNYQYDYLGLKSPDSRKPSEAGCSGMTANVFTVAANELLQAVSVITAEPDCTADIHIYKVPAGTADPTSGELVAEQKGVSLPYAGYHTIVLDEPVSLNAGENFAVMETITNRDGKGYAPIERGSGEVVASEDESATVETAENTVRYIADIEESQSFLYKDGAWIDLAKDGTDGVDKEGNALQTGNVMIKAFTTDLDSFSLTGMSIEVLNAEGQSLGSQQVTEWSKVTLPEGTEAIRLFPTTEGEGTLTITAAGQTVGAEASVSKDLFSQDGLVLTTQATGPRGNNAEVNTYRLSIEIKAAQGSDGEPDTGSNSKEAEKNSAADKNAGTGIDENRAAMILGASAVLLLAAGLGVLYWKQKGNH